MVCNNTVKIYKELSRKKLLMFKIYFFTFFFAQGVHLPLYPIYLSNIAKISEGLIGIILSINPLLSIIFQPFWGLINEKFKLGKKLALFSILVLNTATIIIFLSHEITPLITFMTTYAFIVLFATIYALFSCSIGPIQDTLTLLYVKKYGFRYGDVRIWGSAGYALGAFISGQLVALWNYNVVVILCLIFYGISFISLVKMKQVRTSNIKHNHNKENVFKVIFTNKPFLVFLIFVALGFGVLGALGNYFFLCIKQNGGSEDTIGITTFFIVIIEIIVMIITLKLNARFSDLTLMISAIFLQMPLLLVFIFSNNLTLLIAALLLRGASQGLYIPVIFNFMSSLLSPKHISTGLVAYSVLSIGLTGFITSFSGGFIIENYSYSVFFTIILFLLFISVFVGIILSKVKKHVVIKL